MEVVFSDNELIKGLAQRSEKHIRSVYSQNKVSAIGVISKYLNSESECESIYNDSVLTLVENIILKKFNSTSSLSTYLIGIAKFKALNHLRKKKMLTTELKQEFVDLKYEEPNEHMELATDLFNLTKKGLDKLDNSCKEILIKFYYEEQKLKEMAKQMDLSYDFIRIKKGRCLKKLKNFIAS